MNQRGISSQIVRKNFPKYKGFFRYELIKVIRQRFDRKSIKFIKNALGGKSLQKIYKFVKNFTP